MNKSQVIESLKKIRATIEVDEESYSNEQAERVIERIDMVIHDLEA